jgi:hypothetical protein
VGAVLFLLGAGSIFAFGIEGWLRNVEGISLVVGFVMILLGVDMPGALNRFNLRFGKKGESESILESHATAFIDTKDEKGDRVSVPVGKGLLVLRDDDKVDFVKKKLFGGYQQEPNHSYYVSRIVNLKEYSDGLDVEAYYPATEEGPAEVVTVFYELNDASRWYETLQSMRAKKEPKPAASEATLTPQQPVIREIIKETIREVPMVYCPNCDERYEERLSRCPYCNAPHPSGRRRASAGANRP